MKKIESIVIFGDSVSWGAWDMEKDFDDGLHPNAQGHQKIFEQVKDFLVENEWL